MKKLMMRRRKRCRYGAALTVLLGLLAIANWFCSTNGDVGVDPGWRDELRRFRQEKDREFKTSPTSPMAGVRRLTVAAGSRVFLKEIDGDVTLSNTREPEVKFSLIGEEGKWRWESPGPGITCKAGGKTVPDGSALPGGAEFRLGRLTLTAYPGKEKLTLIVFNPQRPNIEQFSKLLYFPPDPEFVIAASFEKLSQLTPVTMLTSQNLEKTFYRYGRIKFRLEGQDLQLTAFTFSPKPGTDVGSLFIPFSDRTNGKETYGAGRFLEIPVPKAKPFQLDFNYCYNPLCNYSPAYNCPIPPVENNLPVSIRAGEKTYPHH